MFEKKTEGTTKSQLVGRKRGCVTKEAMKKLKKGDRRIRLKLANQGKKKKK